MAPGRQWRSSWDRVGEGELPGPGLGPGRLRTRSPGYAASGMRAPSRRDIDVSYVQFTHVVSCRTCRKKLPTRVAERRATRENGKLGTGDTETGRVRPRDDRLLT